MDLKKIGKNIQSHRHKLGLTQANLAELVELSNTHISHLETGDGTMSLESLIAIADALKTTPDYILLGNFNITQNRSAEIFSDKIQNLTQDEIDYIFEFIDLLNKFKVTHK